MSSMEILISYMITEILLYDSNNSSASTFTVKNFSNLPQSLADKLHLLTVNFHHTSGCSLTADVYSILEKNLYMFFSIYRTIGNCTGP